VTIHGSSGWFTKLDESGQPTGERIQFGENVATFSIGEDEPADSEPISPRPWRTITIEITALDLGTAYLLFGSRRIFGWHRPLAINGHEYRRRVRRR
jgi:hypothetical protein